MQCNTVTLYAESTVPPYWLVAFGTKKTPTILRDTGRYVVALAVNDGPFGGKAAGDESMFLFCPLLGPNACQMNLL